MTELIKEVTPPKRPDLSNPYQTASPVGKVVLPKPRVGKRIRATGKPAVPPATDDKSKEQSEPTEKEKEYSHQAIIEATLPKVRHECEYIYARMADDTLLRSREANDLDHLPTSKNHPLFLTSLFPRQHLTHRRVYWMTSVIL